MSKINGPAPNKKKRAGQRVRPITRPDAAGIDLGALVHFVAVPPDRDAQPVQSFGTQTADLHRLADWLVAHEYNSVDQLQGSVSQRHVSVPAAFERTHYVRAVSSFRTVSR